MPQLALPRERLVLGVDIGRAGALALLTPAGELIDVQDMPTLDDGPKGRPAVNAPLLSLRIAEWRPGRAFVEYVAGRPTDAPGGAFAFGRCRGAIEGVLAAHGVPVRLLTPPWWKRRVGIPPGTGRKDEARGEAIRRWPGKAELFARKGDHDRAEAALIGWAGVTHADLA